jgi:hypothetical protein
VRFLSGVSGTPWTSEAATLWSVPEQTATEAEAEAWRAAQAERVGRLPRPTMGPEQHPQ